MHTRDTKARALKIRPVHTAQTYTHPPPGFIEHPAPRNRGTRCRACSRCCGRIVNTGDFSSRRDAKRTDRIRCDLGNCERRERGEGHGGVTQPLIIISRARDTTRARSVFVIREARYVCIRITDRPIYIAVLLSRNFATDEIRLRRLVESFHFRIPERGFIEKLRETLLFAIIVNFF